MNTETGELLLINLQKVSVFPPRTWSGAPKEVRMIRLTVLFLMWSAVACGDIASPGQHDPGGVHDAAIDTLEPPPLREAREFVNGGTRMTGATYTFDIQVGHAVQQGNAAGATYQFESNAAVKP